MDQADKHFHMSEDYELNSSSQKTIGRVVIQSAIEMAKLKFNDIQTIKALDIACGPGNLTIEFFHALKNNFPASKIDLAGLDYSEINVNHLINNSAGRVHGVVGSFYNLPPETKNQNIIISNEGLHWQPPYPMKAILFSYLDAQEKEKYELFALLNFKTALKNIYEALQYGGIAILQFGHKGNLGKLHDVIHEIFQEEPFKQYLGKINIPVYQPAVEHIYDALAEAGYRKENIDINAFTQDLAEDTPLTITNFYRAVSQPGFSQVIPQNILQGFYQKMEDKLESVDMNEFRKKQWHRTLIKLEKIK